MSCNRVRLYFHPAYTVLLRFRIEIVKKFRNLFTNNATIETLGIIKQIMQVNMHTLMDYNVIELSVFFK